MFQQLINMISGGGKANHLSGTDFKAKYLEIPKALLLDVRTPAEYAGGYLKGAKNINFFSPSFKADVQKLDKDKTYFVYCRSGNRSGQACDTMEQLGYTTYNLAGGIGAWPA